MGVYRVVAPNRQHVSFSTGYGLHNFLHGEIITDDKIYRTFPQYFEVVSAGDPTPPAPKEETKPEWTEEDLPDMIKRSTAKLPDPDAKKSPFKQSPGRKPKPFKAPKPKKETKKKDTE